MSMTKRVGFGLLLVAGCAGDQDGRNGPGAADTPGIDSAEGPNTSAPTQGDDGATGGGPGGQDGPTGGQDESGATPTLFDLGGEASMFCEDKPQGVHCNGSTSILCDAAGNVEDTTVCDPQPCLEGSGCVTCLAGEFACHGPRVMSCNVAGAPFWEEVDVCAPGSAEACDASLGTCVPLSPIGGTEPTGVYYQYALHDTATDGMGFNSVCDVDTFGNRIYFVANQGAQLVVGSYDVELLDTDADGVFEPNQHPDNPDAPGPVEQRVFTFVNSFAVNNPGAYPNVMELHATATKLYWTGPTNGVTEYDLATGTTTQVALPASWLGTSGYSSLSFLGHDDIYDVWYSGNEAARRVMQYDAASMTWGWAFEYPFLAGDHMDGLEVVTDPNTSIPYVYVSDMTSNFIGQYRLDAAQGWVQENLFTYNEATGALVEGFGYGALGHFWVGSYATSLYELGGGDLAEFTGPEG